MAGFTRSNGDAKPTLRYDAAEYENSGANEYVNGATIQTGLGPKIDFFAIANDSTLTDTQLKAAMDIIQNKATVMFHQYDSGRLDPAVDELRVGIYPAGIPDIATFLKDSMENEAGWGTTTVSNWVRFTSIVGG